ncbi:hypothetical protein JHK85_021208 [Glycine max]|nr:hypothetical protein JHK85_021208 [Glycine max]
MSVILPFVSIFLLHVLTATSETILQCLSLHSDPSRPISAVTYFPKNPSYPPILEAYIRNLRFSSPTTPKPTFIVAPTHVSHIQASIICCKRFNLEIRTRSGGHDFEGLSYMSQTPFVIVDMFMLKSVEVDVEDQTAWVDSGSTIGELYYAIAEKSRVLGFPAVPVPEVVTVFRIEKTLEQDASDLVFQWQYVADKIHDGLFIRVVLSPVTRSDRKTIKAKDLPRAMHVLDAMERRGVWADAISYSELIKCCLAHGAVRERKRVHRHIFSNGHHPKTFLTNSLINMSNSTSWKKRRYCSIKCLNEMSCHGLL